MGDARRRVALLPSGGEFDALRAVPGDRVLASTRTTRPRLPSSDLPAASLQSAACRGPGARSLTLLETLREIGAVAPVGVEVFADDLHALDPVEARSPAPAPHRRVLAIN